MVDGVPISSISAVGVLQRVSHGIHFPRDRDEMNTVRHQAVANKCQAVQLNALPQQIEINFAISINIKDAPPSIASLSYVVRHSSCSANSQRRTQMAK
jgi:hypothetical protein